LKTLFSMDPNDVELGRLALLLAPCHVYSHDKHLRISGFSLSLDELDAVIAAGVAVEISDGALVTTGFAMRAGSAGLNGAVKGIAVRLEIPVWVVALVGALLVAGGVWWTLSTPERRAKTEDLLKRLALTASDLAARRAAGKELLERTSLPAAVPSLENRLFRVLAIARVPLLPSEIREAFGSDGEATTPASDQELP
jgi:hypothetical protein